MKNIIYILLIITSSCTIGPSYINSYSLKVSNNTNYDVSISFYNKVDTSEKQSFVVKSNSKELLDSAVYLYSDSEDYASGNLVLGSYLARESSSLYVLVEYRFEDLKISQLQIVDDCTDTSSLMTPCLFAISNLEEIYNKDNIKEKFYTQEYYITNQQYLLADSL